MLAKSRAQGQLHMDLMLSAGSLVLVWTRAWGVVAHAVVQDDRDPPASSSAIAGPLASLLAPVVLLGFLLRADLMRGSGLPSLCN